MYKLCASLDKSTVKQNQFICQLALSVNIINLDEKWICKVDATLKYQLVPKSARTIWLWVVYTTFRPNKKRFQQKCK